MTNTVEGWNEIHKSDYGRRYPFEPLIVYVQRLMARGFEGRAALDIGFGTVADMLMLHESGFDICGLDVSENAVSRAREALTRMNVSHRLDVWMPGQPFPYACGCFDLVVAIACLHYNLDQDGVVGEMARVARSGGRIMATYPSPGFQYWKFTDIVRPGVRRYNDGYPNKNTVGVEFVSFETEQEVYALFARHFCDVEVSRYYYRLLGQDTTYWMVTGIAK